MTTKIVSQMFTFNWSFVAVAFGNFQMDYSNGSLVAKSRDEVRCDVEQDVTNYGRS